MGHLPMLQPVDVGLGQDPALALVQRSVHTCAASRTFAVGSSELSAAVPFVAVSKHETDRLQPGLVPAPLRLLPFLD